MPKADLKWGELPFGYVKTDCHIVYTYRDGKWDAGEVVDGDQITLPIASTCLHYGQECFEGLKVYETRDGRAQAFRPRENAARIRYTASKLLMAPPTEEIFLDGVERATRLNRRFIPPYGSGASLYVRPLLIGTTATVGIKPSLEYRLIVFVSPVGPYFKTGLKPVRLWVETDVDRASPGGVGDAKAGGNYAAGLRATWGARDKGYAEVLFLDSRQKKYVDESGSSNFFAITKDGKYVTPQSPSILASVTNKSLIQMAEDMGITVERRRVEVTELPSFAEAGLIGTATIIAPVYAIQHGEKLIQYCGPDEVGPVSARLRESLIAVQMGDAPDPHGWMHEIELD
ncbi:MAG TPA: branched-chain amino acid aminotransferase [Candidatus Krumholzibacteria bacterium]|nr:branched-chain amino acid aminotransferase [Candidatus Krumholzibacteria bacterium]